MTRLFSIYGWLLAGLLLLSSTQGADAQPRVTLADESQLWIEGSSSVNTFTCAAGTVDGTGIFARPSAPRDVTAEVWIPVRQLDCGKARMNNDLYTALNAQVHPHILFRLDEAHLVTSATDDDGMSYLRATGQLTIAGVERTIALNLQGHQRPDGTYRATGSLPLRMSDFGIDPPTALLGLIKAHDRITVRFDLIATTQLANYTN